MKSVYHSLVLVIMAFSFFQCQKDLSYIGDPDPIPEVPVINKVDPEPITANLQGNILDENGQPAAGVNITVGSKTTTTNSTGYFRILNAGLDKKTALVIAEKSGYFKGIRIFAATSGTNQIVIKLVKKTLAGTLTATTGGSASLANGSKITLPANGVVTATTGAAYTGNVNVYAAYIDPTAMDISQTIPGSFAATDKNGSRVTLSSYGMLAVQLESDAGEKLQIKEGAVASLTTAIPASVLASAPATISLWSIDETTGLWQQEGTATKQGSSYVGDVKHFSFWNCDVPLNAVFISMKLQTADSLPIVYGIVKITVLDSSNRYSFGWTDSLGQVSGMVPSNVSLKVEVLDPCFNPVFSQNVLPLTQNTDLGTITVTSSTPILNTFKGYMADCNNQPVTNGYAIIAINNTVRFAATDSTGSFEVAFVTCSGVPTTATVIGVDNGAQQQGPSSTVTITPAVTNVGTITACGTSSTEFINYVVDGSTYYFINSTAHDSITAYTSSQGSTGFTTYIMGDRPGINSIYFSATGANGTGTFPIGALQIQYSGNVTLISPSNVTFTNFPAAIGDFYEGSLSGSYTVNGSPVRNITATFKVRRTF